jgi:hypothetical protein
MQTKRGERNERTREMNQSREIGEETKQNASQCASLLCNDTNIYIVLYSPKRFLRSFFAPVIRLKLSRCVIKIGENRYFQNFVL